MSPLHSANILVVDDPQNTIGPLSLMLEADGYIVRQASNGQEALNQVRIKAPDLILLDIMRSERDGLAATRQLKRTTTTRHIPIILLTGLSDPQARANCLEAGAEECLAKPVDHVELSVRVRNLLRLKESHDDLGNHNLLLEHQVKLRTAQLEASHLETLYLLMRAAEHRDETMGDHIGRISHYCKTLANVTGMDVKFQQKIYHSSPLHDIGMIGIPDHILRKKFPLTPTEWQVMKTHTTIGEKLLSEGRSDYLLMGAEIARHHHERWDGSGYPDGMAGTAIPLAARIMALCDAYDTLRSSRPYKQPVSHKRAMEVLAQGDERTRPEHFDPDALAAFLKNGDLFSDIFEMSTKEPKNSISPTFFQQKNICTVPGAIMKDALHEKYRGSGDGGGESLFCDNSQ